MAITPKVKIKNLVLENGADANSQPVSNLKLGNAMDCDSKNVNNLKLGTDMDCNSKTILAAILSGASLSSNLNAGGYRVTNQDSDYAPKYFSVTRTDTDPQLLSGTGHYRWAFTSVGVDSGSLTNLGDGTLVIPRPGFLFVRFHVTVSQFSPTNATLATAWIAKNGSLATPPAGSGGPHNSSGYMSTFALGNNAVAQWGTLGTMGVFPVSTNDKIYFGLTSSSQSVIVYVGGSYNLASAWGVFLPSP